MKKAIYLEITRKGTHLEISLSKGEQTLTHYEESCVPSEELGKRCNELMHLLNLVSRRGSIPSSVIEEMQQLGRVLYNEVFPLSIKSQLSESPPSDLILRIDNTLVDVPWELLFDGEYFLCEKFNIGRMVKTQQIVAKRDQTKPVLPLRILIIADPRGDLKASYEEGMRIREQLRMDEVKVTLATSEVGKDYLKKRLFNYDLIHYAGHADYDLKNPSQSGWLLEDGKFTTLDIRKMGGSNPLPWMVFSNACQSGQTEEWKVDETGEEKIYGLANAFLLSGVQHYIGTFWKVLDEPSTNFALKFYDHLLKGASVGESMRSARLALRERYGEGNILWASYLLYGDPGVRYFVSKEEEKGDVSDEEEGMLVGAGAGSIDAQRQQNAYIQRNGLRTRSASDNNGTNGWRFKEEETKKGLGLLKTGFRKAPVWVAGIMLAFILVFGAIFYKTFTGPGLPKTDITNKEVRHEDTGQDNLKGLVISGMASDDQMAEYFQGLVKKYQKDPSASNDGTDLWTSRPIALFFVARDKGGSDIETGAGAEFLVNRLIAFLGQDPRVTILEREYLDTLLKELDLGSSPLADPDHTLRLGQIVSGNLFATSSISRFEGKWQANLRIIASETSIVKSALSEAWSGSEDLDAVASRLAQSILREIGHAFPLKGRIKHFFSENKVMLNIGYRHGVEKGIRFNVLKDMDIVGNDGRPVAADEVHIASLEVTEVKDEFCYATVINRTDDLVPGMKVSLSNDLKS
ncbi:CHAT domain-containing protein [bacterium]|nr:CHAT domain-containing protein [bacterium]